MLWPGILHGEVIPVSRGTLLGPGLVSSGDGNTLSYHCPVSHHLGKNVIKNAIVKSSLHPMIHILFEV